MDSGWHEWKADVVHYYELSTAATDVLVHRSQIEAVPDQQITNI